MTLAALYVVGGIVYLMIGFLVAVISAAFQFTLTVRWWHVVFWPLTPLGWVAVLIGFWMGG